MEDNQNNDNVDVNQSINDAADVLKDVGVFGGLLDFSFSKFVAIRVVKVLYILLLVLIVLGWLGVIFAGFAQGGVGGGLVGIIVATLWAFVNVIFARVGMELIVVLFKIGENTSIIAASKQG
ncbi:DUF4282 domain-containing protein [Planctomycetales bacterium ZRK34]|nr:DUF4282 domain-containing protein [Planctomycetales bacterium ZRK34]